MTVVEVDQLATIHRLVAEFITELEGRGFHRLQIASFMTALGVNLAAASDDPGALALVIEAALHEMNPQRERANGARWYASDAAIAALRPARLDQPRDGWPASADLTKRPISTMFSPAAV
jgi:hypothetical protein